MFPLLNMILCLILSYSPAFALQKNQSNPHRAENSAVGHGVFGVNKKENIYIVADSTIYHYKTGVNIFEGHVKVDQGSTHIRADKLTTKSNHKHEIEEAIAYGLQEQAHYWTTSTIGEPDIHARANIIKFYPIDSNIVLEQHVLMTQAENSFRGQMVLYNMTTQTITVPASKEGQALLVYHPDKS